MPSHLRLLPVAALLAACGHPARPAAHDSASAPPAPPTAPTAGASAAGCPDDPAAATADANLAAMVSQGEALADHVGPDAARAAFADLAAHPTRYLDRFECRYVRPSPAPGYESLLLATPLWRLRHHDRARVAQLAARVALRYQELARTPPDPAVDPGFATRVAQRTSAVELIRDGLDVAAGPRWKAVAPADLSACVTATLDPAPVVRVTRACSCGEPLSCRATAHGAILELDVRYDPDAPARCTDCYPTSTACTLPTLPAGASVTVTAGGTSLATWTSDARGWPTGATCP